MALRDARIRGGEILSARVQEALAELDMPKVRFLTGVVPGDATPYGMDAIDFSVSANAGEAPRPIGKIASGGELSRIMLCLQCVLADVMQTPTLIFDEIDTGISGKTNEKIGRMMAQIASGGKTQVICVTHAAQLAACAFHQYRIAKKEENGRTQTEVLLLDYEERIGELARIMGGLQVTDTVRKAAEELLKGAVT
jgi:DNA repair protein RecN (Recombination protein N)